MQYKDWEFRDGSRIFILNKTSRMAAGIIPKKAVNRRARGETSARYKNASTRINLGILMKVTMVFATVEKRSSIYITIYRW